jgi:hypothetical protein
MHLPSPLSYVLCAFPEPIRMIAGRVGDGVDGGGYLREADRGSTQVATEIRHLISTGTPERQLLATVAQHFPDLSPAEFSVALQTATTQAEQAAERRH